MPTLTTSEAVLRYEDRGEGEPILFLHGLGSSADAWAPQIEHFSARHRCIALDARGSGQSRDLAHPGGPFSLRTFARDAQVLLDELGAAPAHVVGLSMGGMIAFQLAVDSPRSVRSLTIVNSAPAVVPRTPREHAALLTRKLMAKWLRPETMGKALARRLFPKPEQVELRASFIESMAKNDRRAYSATTNAIIGWSVEDRIGEIDAPALILAADGDYTSVASKEAYARRMKHARVVVVSDARHAFPVEHPARFDAYLEDFLNTQAIA